MGLFAALPADFPQLGLVAARLVTGVTDTPPVGLGGLARRLREAYRQARDSNYDSLSPGQWRQLRASYGFRHAPAAWRGCGR